MIAIQAVDRIRELLIEGKLSQRQIARKMGISRGTVSAIASGKRPNYTARTRRLPESAKFVGPLERCPGCGGMVYMPCRLCLAESIARRQPRRPPLESLRLERPLATGLREEHRQRYEQVRAQMLARQAVAMQATNEELEETDDELAETCEVLNLDAIDMDESWDEPLEDEAAVIDRDESNWLQST